MLLAVDVGNTNTSWVYSPGKNMRSWRIDAPRAPVTKWR